MGLISGGSGRFERSNDVSFSDPAAKYNSQNSFSAMGVANDRQLLQVLWPELPDIRAQSRARCIARCNSDSLAKGAAVELMAVDGKVRQLRK